MTKPPHSSEQLRPLTSLRFFAAAAVLLAHTYPYRNPHEPAGFVQLSTGVTFFFVLSGFILTITYFSALRRPTLYGIWNFYIARVVRIWPVHLLTLAAVLPLCFPDLLSGKHGDPIINLASTAALIQTFVVDAKDRVMNAPSWSLSAEFFFYLCFPFLIWGFASRSVTRHVIVLLLALTPWLLAVIQLAQIAPAGTMFSSFYFFPPVRLCDFVAGVLLGLVWHRRQCAELAIRHATIRQATLNEIGSILFLIGWACLWIWLAPTPRESYAVSWAGAYLPPFLLCIWVFACGRGLLSKVLSTRPLVYLGEISFGIYMMHVPVMTYLGYSELGRTLVIWGLKTMGWYGRTLVISLATIAASAACYHLYEMPLRNWLRRKLSIRKAVVPPAAVPVPVVESVSPDRIVSRAA